METVQQSELQERQHAWWWPLDTIACCSDMGTSDSCFFPQLEWDPLLRYLGLGVLGVPTAGDDHRAIEGDELGLFFFPKCMESPGSEQDAETAMPEDQLDELLRNFWELEEKEQLVGFNPSCILEEKSAAASSIRDDDDLLTLCSALPVGHTLPEKAVAGPRPDPSSSSSHCSVAPHASDDGGAQRQTTRPNCSSKRSRAHEDTDAWSGKRSRTASSSGDGPSVVRPFTVVKPGGGGVDGEATLADINERILTLPTRSVRHPVGKFACAPRALAGGDNRPAPSGKAVAGFTRLHTAGKGTITIIRTSG